MAAAEYDPRYLVELRKKSRTLPVFADLDRPEDPAQFFRNAETIASRLKIPDAVLDHLYLYSRSKLSSREEWERELKIATAMYWLIRGFCPGDWYLDGLLDANLTDNFEREIHRLEGAIVLISHDGFGAIARPPFQRCFRGDHFVFKRKWIATAALHVTLFAALRALKENRYVWIAPEGQLGKQVDVISVAGMELPIANGAAFLAYETAAPTIHFNVHRTQRGFAPVIKYGPQRQGRETLAEFRDRLHEFYQGQVDEILTGHPKNLPLWPRRVKAISEYVAARASTPQV